MISWVLAAGALLLAGAAGWWGRQHAGRVRLARRAERLQSLLVGDAAQDGWLGRKVGGYHLVERLGTGGMATVFRAVPADSLDAAQSVAIKILKPELAQDGEFLPRFMREISIYRRLLHAAIVRVFESGQQDDLVYVVLELVHGTSLGELSLGHPLPMARFQTIFRQLVEGMRHAHSQGVVHRDLKAGNIMVDAQDRVKILDFGIARSASDLTITDARFVVGTPFYMSPEQLFGAPFDPRMDQYALGVLAYEMLTGRLPFSAPNMASLVQEINFAAPISPRTYRPDVSEALEALVLRMLQKQPEGRFADLDEVLAAFERC